MNRSEPALQAVYVISEAEFLGMEREWNSLIRESGSDTIFLTWEWLSTWWEAYGEGRELFILRIMRDGTTIGVAPLYKKKISRFGVSLSALEILGSGSADSDYLDLISRKGEEEWVTTALMDFLSQKINDWDVLLLNEIPETSPHLPFIRDTFLRKGWFWEESEVLCAYANLPSDWDTYMKSLKPRMRTKVRSLTKRIEEDYNVHFDQCRQHDDIDPCLKSLYKLHNQRWQMEGKEGVFVSPSKRRFYEEISSVFLSRGWLRFYSLSMNGRYLAHQFCFEYHSKIFLLQEGFDPEWVEHGIGNVLRAYVFRDCIERKVSVYDFLGGVTPHKLSWGAEVKKSLRIMAAPPKAKNRVIFNLSKGIMSGKNGLKAILPEPIKEWISAKRGGN